MKKLPIKRGLGDSWYNPENEKKKKTKKIIKLKEDKEEKIYFDKSPHPYPNPEITEY